MDVWKNRNRSSKGEHNVTYSVNKWQYVCSHTNSQLTVTMLFAHQISILSCNFKNLLCGMHHTFFSSPLLPWGFGIKITIGQLYLHSKGFLSNKVGGFLWTIQRKTHVTKHAADLKCHLCKKHDAKKKKKRQHISSWLLN